MPSLMCEVDDAIGKRKREFNAPDERDIEREREMQMKLAAASQYATSPTQIYNAFQRQIFPTRFTPSTTKRSRFLLSPKETTAFPGSATHNDTNSFLSLQMESDLPSASHSLYNTPVTAYTGSCLASMVTAQAPPAYNPTTTLHSLHHNIRMINQGILQNQTTNKFVPSQRGSQSPYTTYSPDAVSKAALAAPKMNLNPCHICQRRPLQKKDLESYTDCEGCGERCCWICVRECLGSIYATRTPSPAPEMQPWHIDQDHEMGDGDASHEDMVEQRRIHETKWPAIGGHRSKVCSRCCVEKGKDGEVRCIGCVRAEERR